MDLVGIGVLIIGIAFAVAVIFLARTLNNLSGVLQGVEKTVGKLPEQLDQITDETGNVIHNTNETIIDVNEKLETLNPVFYIVQDAGEASRKLSSSMVDVTAAWKKNTSEAEETASSKNLGGIYGAAALVYFLAQKRKEKQREDETNGIA
ncbi:uncharacterized protein YoxC [Salsuginibacillus halophilus]|uniref:Uncharacterized protein YoxC n=1 Tax=Salsuginibacillus halophilus TaxID=517424 RepID=A0A2P8HXV2_9BACI|nr:DUF948 domain-containing protein [Salsuginibacillus halophilus]PSL50975.1 uncharacterized protein YoxC [Salsuginibacillus halophilus]